MPVFEKGKTPTIQIYTTYQYGRMWKARTLAVFDCFLNFWEDCCPVFQQKTISTCGSLGSARRFSTLAKRQTHDLDQLIRFCIFLSWHCGTTERMRRFLLFSSNLHKCIMISKTLESLKRELQSSHLHFVLHQVLSKMCWACLDYTACTIFALTPKTSSIPRNVIYWSGKDSS